MMEFINFYLIPGVVLGCIYALGAIGISLTYGILRFSNFAHGDTMTLGVYITLSLVQVTGGHPLLVAPLAMVLTTAVVLALDRAFFKPFRTSPTIMLVIASFGLMLMIRSVIQFFWGVQLQALRTGIEQMWVFADALRILPRHILIIAATFALMMVVHLVLTRTKIGKAMRATSDNPELSAYPWIGTTPLLPPGYKAGVAFAIMVAMLIWKPQGLFRGRQF